jgi:TPR repeat protein
MKIILATLLLFTYFILPVNLSAGESLKKAALFGDANAQFELGSKYFHGDPLTPKNPKKAIKYLSKASEQGHEKATLILSNIYLNGSGIEKDAYASYRLIHAAAWKGLPNAQAVLGVYYCDGIGVEADIVQCCAWYDVSAAQGIEEAKKAIAETIKKMTPAQIKKATELSKDLWFKLVEKNKDVR